MNKKKENALNLNIPYEEALAFKEFDAYESLLLRYLIRKKSKIKKAQDQGIKILRRDEFENLDTQ